MNYKVKYAGNVKVIEGQNKKILYEHQIEAMENLNRVDKKERFSAIVVLPTGGGKTLTATWWLLKNAVDKGKKILWIAHRHLLLEQAGEAFKRNAYSNILINQSDFNLRIVSGKHDKSVNIKNTDDVLIASKDSLIRNLDKLDRWVKNEKEIYLVIDEAHHATAKSYRKLINYMKTKVQNLKLLGLTATPFRTNEAESGALKEIFTDDIIYKIDLKDLIKKGILSRPKFDECETNEEFGKGLGLNKIKSIELLDKLPEDISNSIAENKKRNALIVEKYKKNKDSYGKTLVFAVNRLHAYSLQGLFEKYGIRAGVVVSGTTTEFTGIDISNAENEKNINDYKYGDVNVLINVNILTEGVDLPKTKTVFLTRPTVSSILMTQMIGRALRGERAGGTKEANIVTFIDNWKENFAWVNPENLLDGPSDVYENNKKRKNREIRLISIEKIKEFTKIIDDSIDTTELEKIDFLKRVPLGIYTFTFIEESEIEKNHQVLVYDSTKKSYEKMISGLSELFRKFNIESEILENEILNKLSSICKENFSEDMLPAYDEKDIRCILKYYAQKECEPTFIPFDEVDRRNLDISLIAKEIVEKDMRRSEQTQLINKLWDEENSIIRIYFNKKSYFTRQLQMEIDKLDGLLEDISENNKDNFKKESRRVEDLSLYEIKGKNTKLFEEIREKIYNKNKENEGIYYCNQCGKRSKKKAMFEIDHIVPMAKGGKTTLENLQLLCRKCNRIKGDK